MSDERAREIADSLTERQREVLLAAWRYPDFHRQGEQVSYCPIWVNTRNRDAMHRLKLIEPYAEGGPRVSQFGLAVRRILEEGNNAQG